MGHFINKKRNHDTIDSIYNELNPTEEKRKEKNFK